MSPDVINKITNVVAFILAVLEPIRAYLSSQEFNWMTFALCIGSAVIAYFTGKSGLYSLTAKGGSK